MNKREAKSAACTMAASLLLKCGLTIGGSREDQKRFNEAVRELVRELARRGETFMKGQDHDQ